MVFDLDFEIPSKGFWGRKPETGCKAVRIIPKHAQPELSPWHLPTQARQRNIRGG